MIQYVKGDVTRPLGKGPRIVAHICNDVGAYGAGVALAIRHRWPVAREQYSAWYGGRLEAAAQLRLGMVQLVKVGEALWVANMVGQRALRGQNGVPPIRYRAVRQCLGELGLLARHLKATVHMPRIGCGLAGGSWDRMEPIINEQLVTKGIDVTVYDL